MSFIFKCCWLLGSQSIGQYVVIAIVGSRFGWTWRRGRYGDKDVDRGRVNIVDADKGLSREINK